MVPNVKECKNLIKPWWLQLSQRQKLTFLRGLKFGTVRSEVRILSPRPITSNTYGRLCWRPYFLVVAKLRTENSPLGVDEALGLRTCTKTGLNLSRLQTQRAEAQKPQGGNRVVSWFESPRPI